MPKVTLEFDVDDRGIATLKRTIGDASGELNKLKAATVAAAGGSTQVASAMEGARAALGRAGAGADQAGQAMDRTSLRVFRFQNAIENTSASIVGQFAPGLSGLFGIFDRVGDAGERAGGSFKLLGLAAGGAIATFTLVGESVRRRIEETAALTQLYTDLGRAVRTVDFSSLASGLQEAAVGFENAQARGRTFIGMLEELGARALGLLGPEATARQRRGEFQIARALISPVLDELQKAQTQAQKALGDLARFESNEGLMQIEQGALKVEQAEAFSRRRRNELDFLFANKRVEIQLQAQADMAKLEEAGAFNDLNRRQKKLAADLALLDTQYGTEKDKLETHLRGQLEAIKAFEENARAARAAQQIKSLEANERAATAEANLRKARYEREDEYLRSIGGVPLGQPSLGTGAVEAAHNLRMAQIDEELEKEKARIALIKDEGEARRQLAQAEKIAALDRDTALDEYRLKLDTIAKSDWEKVNEAARQNAKIIEEQINAQLDEMTGKLERAVSISERAGKAAGGLGPLSGETAAGAIGSQSKILSGIGGLGGPSLFDEQQIAELRQGLVLTGKDPESIRGLAAAAAARARGDLFAAQAIEDSLRGREAIAGQKALTQTLKEQGTLAAEVTLPAGFGTQRELFAGIALEGAAGTAKLMVPGFAEREAMLAHELSQLNQTIGAFDQEGLGLQTDQVNIESAKTEIMAGGGGAMLTGGWEIAPPGPETGGAPFVPSGGGDFGVGDTGFGFQHGGIVRGPSGSPRLVRAEGGEMVLNPDQQAAVRALLGSNAGAGTQVIILQVDGHEIARVVNRAAARGQLDFAMGR